MFVYFEMVLGLMFLLKWHDIATIDHGYAILGHARILDLIFYQVLVLWFVLLISNVAYLTHSHNSILYGSDKSYVFNFCILSLFLLIS